MNNFLSIPVIWFLVGLLLMLAELVVPGLVMIFFGIGAWVAALVAWIFDISLNTQLLIFLVASLASLGLLRRMIKERYINTKTVKDPDLNEEYIGKTAFATDDFDANGKGKVSFKGASWDAESKHPVSKGQKLIITGFQSILLFVEPSNIHTTQ